MQCHALFIHAALFENVQGFTELRNKQKKWIERYIGPEGATNEKQVRKRQNVINIVTEQKETTSLKIVQFYYSNC